MGLGCTSEAAAGIEPAYKVLQTVLHRVACWSCEDTGDFPPVRMSGEWALIAGCVTKNVTVDTR